MKQIITILLLISNLSVFSQTEAVVGNYESNFGNNEAKFEYKLTLNQDGTFFFDYYSNIKDGMPREEKKYGKGTWKIENKLVLFNSITPNDFNEKYTLDFSKSKARFITKSPRDNSNRIIKTELQFLESEIFWMRRIAMQKL